MRKEFQHFQEKLATRTRKQIFTSFYTSFFTPQTLSYYLVSVFSLILLIWYRYRNKYLIHTLEDNMPGVCLPANSLSYTTLEQELFADSSFNQSKLTNSDSNAYLQFSLRNQEKEEVCIQRPGSSSLNNNFEDVNLYPHSLFARVSESWEKEKTSSYKGLFRGKNPQQSLQKGNRYIVNKRYPSTKWFQVYNREFMGFSPSMAGGSMATPGHRGGGHRTPLPNPERVREVSGNRYSRNKYTQKEPDFVTTWFHSLDELPSKISSTAVLPLRWPGVRWSKQGNKGGHKKEGARDHSIGLHLKELDTSIGGKTFFRSLTQAGNQKSTFRSIFLFPRTKEIKEPNFSDPLLQDKIRLSSKNLFIFFAEKTEKRPLLFAFSRKTPFQAQIHSSSCFVQDKENCQDTSPQQLKDIPTTSNRMVAVGPLFEKKEPVLSSQIEDQLHIEKRRRLDLHAKIQLCDKQFPQVVLIAMKKRLGVINPIFPLDLPRRMSGYKYPDTAIEQVRLITSQITSKGRSSPRLFYRCFENKTGKKRGFDCHPLEGRGWQSNPWPSRGFSFSDLFNSFFSKKKPNKNSFLIQDSLMFDSRQNIENQQKRRSSVLHAKFPPSLVMPLNIELCKSKRTPFESHYIWTFESKDLSSLGIKGVHASLTDRRDQDASIETIDQAKMWDRFSADNSRSDRRENFFGKSSHQTHFRSFLKDFGFVLLQNPETELVFSSCNFSEKNCTKKEGVQIDKSAPPFRENKSDPFSHLPNKKTSYPRHGFINEVNKTPLWRSSALRSLANFSEGWKANTRIGPMVSKLQVADTMGLVNKPFEADSHLKDKKVKLQNWWIGKQLDWEGKISGFQKVPYQKVSIETAAFEWGRLEKRPGEKTGRSFSPFKDKTLFLPSTVLKGRIRVPYVTNLEWLQLIQNNLSQLREVKEFGMYDLRLFVPRVKYQRLKQKMPTISLSLFEYKGTPEKGLQVKDFPTNTNFKLQKIGTNKSPIGHFTHDLKKSRSSWFFSSKKKTTPKVKIQFHYPPFSQLSSSPTTLDLFSYGGLYRDRQTIYEFSDSQLGALQDKLLHLISDSFFPIKSRIQEGFNFVFQNKQIKGLVLLLTSSKSKKALYFHERWEPITLNSWLVVTKLFYLLWSFNLIGSLYNKYGKEFFRILLDLLGKNENITNDLEVNPAENEFRIFASSNQQLKDVAVVDNILLELGAIVWYFRTFKTRSISLSKANPFAKQIDLGTDGMRKKKRNKSIVNKKRPVFVPDQISNKLLFVGPPGTGKTLLVKAISGEGKVPVLVQSASMLMGNPINNGDSKTGPEQLRAVFEKARTLAPCILFIDEIDTLGGKRKKMVSPFEDADFLTTNLLPTSVYHATLSNELILTPKGLGRGSRASNRAENGVTRQSSPGSTMGFDRKGFYLTTDVPIKVEDNLQTEGSKGRTDLGTFFQFLVELDGLQSNQKSGMQFTTNTKSRDGVLIIGATNRPNVLDPALTRPGRFDQVFNLQLPGKQKRIEILKIYSKNLGVSDKLPWEYLAKLVEGVSPAHIAAAMNESAIKGILNNTTHTVSTIEHGIRVVTCSTKEEINPRTLVGCAQPVVSFFEKKNQVHPLSSQNTKSRSTSKYTEAKSNGTFQKNYKDPFFLIRRAFYQAGRSIIYKKGSNSPSPVILSLWVQQKSRQGKTDSSFGSVSQPFLQVSSRANLESRLIGWYAGKASELLVTSSLKIDRDALTTSKGSDVPYMRKEFATSLIKKSELMHRRLWSSDLGTDELRSAGCLAESMIDSWYLYSNRIALGKWHGLASQQNRVERSYTSTPFSSHLMGKRFGGNTKKRVSSEAFFLSQLMSQIEKNLKLRSSFSFSAAQTSWYARKKNTNLRIAVSKEEKDQNKAFSSRPLLPSSSLPFELHSNGMVQSRLAQVWWQNEIGHHVERAEGAYSQWYRLYLPNPLYKLRNVEWVSPDKYAHGNDSLKSFIPESERFSLNWNEFYRINRDYLYHGLIVTSFEKSFALLDKNREILDCVAYYLFRRKTLRQYELDRILEGLEE